MTKVNLLLHEFVTHDTRRFILTRPEQLEWEAGQGIEIAIDSDEGRNDAHPFTPVSLQRDRALAFIIKRYETDGMTGALHALEPGAPLLLGEPFGTIRYRGPGVFIAAGTGITPFLAILRERSLAGDLDAQTLICSHKSERDLIGGKELRHLLGDRAIFTFTREHEPSHLGRRIDTAFLREHIVNPDQWFYVCGPDAFVKAVNKALVTLGVHPDRQVYEH